MDQSHQRRGQNAGSWAEFEFLTNNPVGFDAVGPLNTLWEAFNRPVTHIRGPRSRVQMKPNYMFKHLKVINQSIKIVNYTFITIKTWHTGVLDTELQARRQDSRGRGRSSPQPSPCSSQLWLWHSLCPEQSAAQKEHPQALSPSSDHPLPPLKELNLDLLSGWDMGLGREAGIGSGSRDFGVQVLRARLEGAGLQVATPPGPLGLPLGRVQPQNDGAGLLNQRFSVLGAGVTWDPEILSQWVWLKDKIPCFNSLPGQAKDAGPQAWFRTAGIWSRVGGIFL